MRESRDFTYEFVITSMVDAAEHGCSWCQFVRTSPGPDWIGGLRTIRDHYAILGQAFKFEVTFGWLWPDDGTRNHPDHFEIVWPYHWRHSSSSDNPALHTWLQLSDISPIQTMAPRPWFD